MKKWILLLSLFWMYIPLKAQPPRPPATPNDTLKSVEYRVDGRLTFRIYAPKASQVTVTGDFAREFGPKNLSKNDVGVWTYTTVEKIIPD